MEWTVVGVIVALVGLFVTVGAPIIRLNGNIARSNVILDRLEKELAAQKMDAKESHRRLWKHNDDQDERIGDHETRITILKCMTSLSGLRSIFFRLSAHCTSHWLAFGDCPTESRS